MNQAFTYFREVKKELAHVDWPKRSEVVKLTATVIIICGIIGIYVGGLDFAFTKILESIISK